MNLTQCEIAQQVEYLKQALNCSNIEELNTAILKIISEHKTIKKGCFILHDKDVLEDGTPKPPHYHIYLHFGCSQDMELIAKWFNTPIQYIERIKGRWANAIQYATHHNALSKHQYQLNEVITYNMSVEDDMKLKNACNDVFKTIVDYADGKISRHDLLNEIGTEEWLKNKRKIDDAKALRSERLRKEKSMSEVKVIYVTGATGGCGKTTYAHFVARQVCGYPEYDICVSSSSNDILQDYTDEKVLIIDDFRDSCMSFNDLMKMLDPHYRSSSKSRYSNKFLECELIIITSVQAPYDLYKNLNEDKGQLYRRLTELITINSQGSLYIQHPTFERGAWSFDKGNWSRLTMKFIYDFLDDNKLRTKTQDVKDSCERALELILNKSKDKKE